MRSLECRRHRHDGPAAPCRGDLQQHRQHDDHRLQAPAAGVPGSPLPEPAPDRRDLVGRGHGRAGRRAAGPRRQDRGRLPDPRAGRARQHREQLRSRDPGQRLFRGRAPRRRARLHPLGQLPAQPRGPARHPGRLHGEPGVTVPQDAVEVSINQEGRCRPRSRARSPSRSWASCSSRPSSTRPGWRPRAATCCRRPRPRARPWPAPPGTEGLGTVLQGFLESSNVNPVQEITALIAAQRAYDMNSKVITASDEMMATVTQLRWTDAASPWSCSIPWPARPDATAAAS